MENKKSKKGIVIALVIFAGIVLAFLAIYSGNKATGTEGSKAIKIVVVDADGVETNYELNTDQEYLMGAFDELTESQDFTYDGLDQSAGFIIQEINGNRAVYEEDGSYWAMYLNGEYAQYGIKDQPITDGDEYKFAIEKM